MIQFIKGWYKTFTHIEVNNGKQHHIKSATKAIKSMIALLTIQLIQLINLVAFTKFICMVCAGVWPGSFWERINELLTLPVLSWFAGLGSLISTLLVFLTKSYTNKHKKTTVEQFKNVLKNEETGVM